MKSEDLRKIVVRMTDDGMSSLQIAKQLRKVVSERTIRRWQYLTGLGESESKLGLESTREKA